jgi:hypothetical protein
MEIKKQGTRHPNSKLIPLARKSPMIPANPMTATQSKVTIKQVSQWELNPRITSTML